MSEEKPFNTVAFVLFGIWMACMIFPGISLKAIPPKAAGLALLVAPALTHVIGLALSIYHRHTIPAIIINLFLGGFWLFYGIGLICLPAADINVTEIYMEPGIAIAIACLQDFYKKTDKSLRYILIWLAATIAFLWLSKFIGLLETFVPYAIWALGLGTLVVAMHQLRKQLEKQS